MSCPIYFSDLPRTMTREQYRFYHWLLRKTWRENHQKYEEAWIQTMVYGSAMCVAENGALRILPLDTTG